MEEFCYIALRILIAQVWNKEFVNIASTSHVNLECRLNSKFNYQVLQSWIVRDIKRVAMVLTQKHQGLVILIIRPSVAIY